VFFPSVLSPPCFGGTVPQPATSRQRPPPAQQGCQLCWAHGAGVPHPSSCSTDDHGPAKLHTVPGSLRAGVVSLVQRRERRFPQIASRCKFCGYIRYAAVSFETLHPSVFSTQCKISPCNCESCRLEIHFILTLLYLSFLECFYDPHFLFLCSSE